MINKKEWTKDRFYPEEREEIPEAKEVEKERNDQNKKKIFLLEAQLYF